MSVYKDKNTNTWYFSVRFKDYTGKQKQTTRRGFKLKRDAEQAQAEFLAARQFDDKTTFKQAADAYIAEITPQRKMATIDSYTYWLDHAMTVFHDMPLASIDSRMILEWYNGIISKYSQKTAVLIDTHFRTFYRYGIRRLGIDDALQYLPPRRRQIEKKVKFWTIDQYKRFRSVVDDSFYLAIFDLLYYSGIRIGELCGLTIADVDLEAAEISINRTRSVSNYGVEYVNSPKTGGGLRSVIIPGFVRDELADVISKLYKPASNSWLFDVSQKNIRRYFARYTEAAGLPAIHVHDLRHSHASLLIYLNFSPVAIAARLGHDDVKQTLNTYSHMYPNQQADMAEKLALVHFESNNLVTESAALVEKTDK